MAPSKGFIGRGTVLSIGVAGTPETFAPLAQLKTLQFNGQKINFDDISNLDSPLVNALGVIMKEPLPATAEGGSVQVAGVFLPSDAGQLALSAAYGGTLQDFTIQLPKGPGQVTSGNKYAFSGYVAEDVLPDIQFDKAITFKANITLATVIAKTPGA